MIFNATSGVSLKKLLENVPTPTQDGHAVNKAYADNLVKNVPTPTQDGHAASKAYVDSFQPVLLWENASPTSEFAAQTVSVDLSGFSYIEIIFFHWMAESTMCMMKLDPRYEATVFCADGVQSTVYSRRISPDAAGLRFSDAYLSGTLNNGMLTPQKIYGIR